jgi:hypothetical protein
MTYLSVVWTCGSGTWHGRIDSEGGGSRNRNGTKEGKRQRILLVVDQKMT